MLAKTGGYRRGTAAAASAACSSICPSGRGKTRAMFEILRRLHFAGVSAAWPWRRSRSAEHAVMAASLSRHHAKARFDAQDWLRRAKTVARAVFRRPGQGGRDSMPGFARAFTPAGASEVLPPALLVTTERVGDELAACSARTTPMASCAASARCAPFTPPMSFPARIVPQPEPQTTRWKREPTNNEPAHTMSDTSPSPELPVELPTAPPQIYAH